jgi:hypothetical protein
MNTYVDLWYLHIYIFMLSTTGSESVFVESLCCIARTELFLFSVTLRIMCLSHLSEQKIM